MEMKYLKTFVIVTTLPLFGVNALNRGCPNFLVNTLHLLWAGSRAACVQITINGLHNHLNYFVIFIIYIIYARGHGPQVNTPVLHTESVCYIICSLESQYLVFSSFNLLNFVCQ
jgi:hypothetical protein